MSVEQDLQLTRLELAERQKQLAKAQLQITAIQTMFNDALQSDLEHGVKCLNENALKEFHEKYPQLTLALQYLSDME